MIEMTFFSFFVVEDCPTEWRVVRWIPGPMQNVGRSFVPSSRNSTVRPPCSMVRFIVKHHEV
eukprot:scaffold9027_cov174-Amphora_coffeaeformis.AAC.5